MHRKDRKLVLAGHYAGENIVLYGVRFREGQVTLPGSEDHNGLCNLLAKCYQAYEEGSPELIKAQKRDRKFKEEKSDGTSDLSKTPEQRGGEKLRDQDNPPVPDDSSETASDGTPDVEVESGRPELPSDREGHGSEDPITTESDFADVVRAAVRKVDPQNLDLWTDEHGWPKIDAINEHLPEHLRIDKRGTVAQYMPGYTRETAEAERSE